LADSGTGEGKLAPARELLKLRPDAPVSDVINSLRQGGAGPGTLRKVEDLLGVKLPTDVQAAHATFPVRSPLGGCQIGGQFFAAGSIIPTALVDAASPVEVQTLCRPSTVLGPQPITPPVEEPKKTKGKSATPAAIA